MAWQDPVFGLLRAARCLVPLVVSAGLSAPAAAVDGPVPVDVELVLAVDISYSMDEEEQRLQRHGYIAALTSREFHEGLRGGAHGRIAVTYVEWAGVVDQRVLVKWFVIDGPASAQAFAEKLAEAPYSRARRTSIAGMIDAAVKMFADNGFHGARRVIDVSGDGPNNDGRGVTAARDDAVAQGITINGLPLVSIRPYNNFADVRDLDLYYADCVIGGPGAFMVPIRDRTQFVEATRIKLVLEVAEHLPWKDAAPAVRFAQDGAPRVPCSIGEQMWNQRWGN